MDKSIVRNRIDRIGACKSLRTEYPEDYAFFYELFQKHPRAERKGVSKIVDIYIDFVRGDYILGYLLEDRTRDTISWNKCLTGKEVTTEHLLTRAMRTSVDNQLRTYKYMQTEGCVLCGSNENPTADHYPVKFRDIKQEFLATHTTPSVFTKNSASQDCFRKEDNEFETAWKEFHQEKATYRILCYTCNVKEH